VDTGAGTLTSARKFLEGRWTLESFEVRPPGKAPILLKGQGTLVRGPLGTDRPRHWVVEGDVLTLTTKDDAGQPLSIGRWRKSQGQ
jgi:hypothetical protein